MTHGHIRRLAALTLMAVSATGLLAACGSSSSPSSSSSAAAAAGGAAGVAGGGPAGAANRAKLVACLKQHGVTLPTRPPGPRPGTGTGTTPGAGQPGGGPAPGATGARRRGFFGGGAGAGRFNNPKFRAAFQACGAAGGFGRRGGTPARASIAKFVTCVSQHGYKLPKPNFSGQGPVFPAKIETNPKFIAASRACQAQLRPPAGSAAGGGTTAGA